MARQPGRQKVDTEPGERADFVRFRDEGAQVLVGGKEAVDVGWMHVELGHRER